MLRPQSLWLICMQGLSLEDLHPVILLGVLVGRDRPILTTVLLSLMDREANEETNVLGEATRSKFALLFQKQLVPPTQTLV